MAPQQPSPLSLDEHRDLSAEIRSARVRMLELNALVVDVYGAQSAVADAFEALAAAFQNLDETMRAQATVDLPNAPTTELYR